MGPKRPDVVIRTINQFKQKFSCSIRTLPRNVILLGWSAENKYWYCAPQDFTNDPVVQTRLPPILHFLENLVIPKLPDKSFWTLLCLYDGWRERNVYSAEYRYIETPALDSQGEWKGNPGEIPILSPDRKWISCFGTHKGDPSGFLFPEAHYLLQNYYDALFTTVRENHVRWDEKISEAIFCAGNHGVIENYYPPIVSERPHPRQYLHEIASKQKLPIQVNLGKWVPQIKQLEFKYILDVDGYARTWDAWAWKMQSGSTILSVNSPWESYFTRLFEPWVHYVPIENDLSDLAEKLEWCTKNDDACRLIAHNALEHGQRVYKLENVVSTFSNELQSQLAKHDF